MNKTYTLKNVMIMADLISHLQSIQQLSPRLTKALQAGVERQKLPARHLLLQPGRVSQQIYFVEQGLIHGYNSQDGREISSWFMREGDFVVSIVSFFTQTPSTEYIQLLEPSIIYSLSHAYLQSLYQQFPEFNFIGRLLTERYYVLSEQRAYSLRAFSATERYLQLVSDFPDIFQRVSTKHIASHLGIAPETLSRLRSK